MVHKRYLKKGGKVFGPYYYESYREGKSIRKKYIGDEKDYKKWLEKKKGKTSVEQPRKFTNSLKMFSFIFVIIVALLLILVLGNNLGKLFLGKSFIGAGFTGFAVSENEKVIEKIDTNSIDLEIKEPAKVRGESVSKNKNRRMEFDTPEGNIRLYFDLLDYFDSFEELD